MYRILKEADSVPAQDYAESNFEVRDSDNRYKSVEFHSFYPKNSLTNAKKIEFDLPRFTGPNMYLPADIYLKLALILCKPDDSAPANTKQISPCNNILHSMFSECKVYIEDYLINESNENYPYKAFMTDLLTYDMNSKFSFLRSQGFYQDIPNEMNGTTTNVAFGQRRDLFKNADKNAYSLDPVVFVGKLHTDFRSTDNGIVPGISLKIELTRTPIDFILKVPAVADAVKYKLKIDDAVLLCPVATLTEDNWTKIDRLLSEGPSHIYYKRVQVTNKAIPATSKNFVSENLFSSTQLPSRLFIGFLETNAFLGERQLNPFNFARKWIYPGVGDGSSRAAQLAAQPSPAPSGVQVGADRVVYLEQVSLTLNGKALDGWESRASERDDPMMYMRLQHVLGFTKSRIGNNLTPEEFMGGAYFCVYDLSTCGLSAIDYLIPKVRLGNLRLKVEFSASTVQELTMIMYAEYPSLITIDKFRRIKMSFV